MWVCQSDFNAITHHHEKEGGRRKSQRQIDEFKEVIHDLGMEDLGLRGQQYTWCNNQRGEHRVYESLDIVLIKADWGAKHPNEMCTNEVAIDSDYSPIILLSNQKIQKNKKEFRFEEM